MTNKQLINFCKDVLAWMEIVDLKIDSLMKLYNNNEIRLEKLENEKLK